MGWALERFVFYEQFQLNLKSTTDVLVFMMIYNNNNNEINDNTKSMHKQCVFKCVMNERRERGTGQNRLNLYDITQGE